MCLQTVIKPVDGLRWERCNCTSEALAAKMRLFEHDLPSAELQGHRHKARWRLWPIRHRSYQDTRWLLKFNPQTLLTGLIINTPT